ncbi:MAG: hypothetical protein AAB416_01350 [Patescibacteria group bacterium]
MTRRASILLFGGIVTVASTGFFAIGLFSANANNHIAIELTARPGFIQRGQSTVLTWTTRGAVGCRALRDWNGEKQTAGSQLITPDKAVSLYGLSCWDSQNETVTMQVSVELLEVVTTAQVPTIQFVADRMTVGRGSAVRLSWGTQQAALCTSRSIFANSDRVLAPVALQWSSQDQVKSGALDVTPTESVDYILECTSGQYGVSKMLHVEVIDGASPPPVANNPNTPLAFTVSQAVTGRGTNAQLSWRAGGGFQCNATSAMSGTSEGSRTQSADGWSGSRDASGSAQVLVSEATRYSIRCSSSGAAWIEQSVRALTTPSPTPNLLPPSLTVSNGSSILKGQTVSVSWNAENAVGCSVYSPINEQWFGLVNTTGSVSLSPRETTTYQMRCWNRIGIDESRSVKITVSEEQDIDLVFSASSDFILPGESVELTWTGTNARTCTASGSWFGIKQPQGGETVTPPDTMSYTITCTAGSKTATKTVIVRVGSRLVPARFPTLSFRANHREIPAGGSVELTWRGTNVSRCTSGAVFLEKDGSVTKKTIRDEWSAATRPADGSLVVSPIMDTAYRLTCVGDGVVISKTATIKVGGQASPPSGGDVSVDLAFTASPQVATRGKGTTLRWRSARATSCTASGAWKGERELSSFEGTPVSPGKHSEYRLTCANDFGFAAEMTLTIESQDSPQGFYAQPSSVFEIISSTPGAAPDSKRVKWSSIATADCSASGAPDWFGYKPTWGTSDIAPVASSTLTLDCWNAVGTLAKQARMVFASSTTAVTSSPSLPATSNLVTTSTPPTHQNATGSTTSTPVTPPQQSIPPTTDQLEKLRPRAITVRRADLRSFPIAPFNLKNSEDDDSDGDGLSDTFESAIGTNALDPDTDGDGYADWLEALKGYPPFAAGSYTIENEMFVRWKGAVLVEEGASYLWYLNSRNKKRYLILYERDLKHAQAKGSPKKRVKK